MADEIRGRPRYKEPLPRKPTWLLPLGPCHMLVLVLLRWVSAYVHSLTRSHNVHHSRKVVDSQENCMQKHCLQSLYLPKQARTLQVGSVCTRDTVTACPCAYIMLLPNLHSTGTTTTKLPNVDHDQEPWSLTCSNPTILPDTTIPSNKSPTHLFWTTTCFRPILPILPSFLPTICHHGRPGEGDRYAKGGCERTLTGPCIRAYNQHPQPLLSIETT